MKKIFFALVCVISGSVFAQGDMPMSIEQKQMAKQKLQETDVNKDKKISRQEYLTKSSQRFDMKDLNNDGFIDRKEMFTNHKNRVDNRSVSKE